MFCQDCFSVHTWRAPGHRAKGFACIGGETLNPKRRGGFFSGALLVVSRLRTLLESSLSPELLKPISKALTSLRNALLGYEPPPFWLRHFSFRSSVSHGGTFKLPPQKASANPISELRASISSLNPQPYMCREVTGSHFSFRAYHMSTSRDIEYGRPSSLAWVAALPAACG